MNDPTLQLASFLARAEKLLERIEPLLPPASPMPDWSAAIAFRWRRHGNTGYLQPISRPSTFPLQQLSMVMTWSGSTARIAR